jgi:hypothetical protein
MDCIGSRNTSCSWTGLNVIMNRKVEKSLIDLEGMHKRTESNTEGQTMLRLKALMRKTASRCLLLLLMWKEGKFNSSKMSSYLKYLCC